MQSSVSFNHASPPTARIAPEDTRQPEQGRRVWRLPILFLVLVALVALVLALTSPDVRRTISGLTRLLSILFCLGCTLWLAARTPRGRTKWAWIFLALGQVSYAAGNIIMVLSFQNASPASASLADVFLLQLAPFTLVGVLLFPLLRISAAKQVRVILDVGIVLGALFGLALVFLIAPRYHSGAAVGVVFIGYPVVDFTLLLVLIVLLARGVQSSYRPVLFWLMGGFLCLMSADTAYNYLSLPDLHVGPAYAPGTFFVDPFWVAGVLALSLAPLSLLRSRQPRPQWAWGEGLTTRTPRLRASSAPSQLFLLVAPVLLLFGLLIAIQARPDRQGAVVPLLILTGLVVLLIITRQLLTTRDLLNALSANERAAQLDSLKDQFITSVNHELRTPLMTMQGYIELLADPEAQATPAKRLDMLERAQGACANLVHLVKSILDTRRIEEEAGDYTPEAVNVREVAQAALTLVDPLEADRTGRHVQLYIPADLAVWGDPVRVQQIITNLISNAIKYSSPETPIIIGARLIPDKSARFLSRVSASRAPGQMVEIAVQDQGLGIPPEQRELLFRRFVRLPRDIASSVHGNGLGLYLCRVFAQAMGGTVGVVSTGIPGEGSIFFLRLPAQTEEGPATLPEAGAVSMQGQPE
ncbi:MAG TPA: HAMP domain-containing sensor histidine kinase [Ktedonobacterales bacterium]|jgi:signal transduction histidine kinase